MRIKFIILFTLILTTACNTKKNIQTPPSSEESKKITATTVEDEVNVPSVADVQKALNNNGAKLKVDGRMGPNTKAAIKTFQQKNKLKVTGIVDQVTLEKLGLL